MTIKHIIVVLAVAAVSFLMSLQGWKTHFSPDRGQDYDLVVPMEEARQFIEGGRIPITSGRASMLASLPPGVSWLLVPGEVIFKDPRLYESVGAGLLFFLTVFGIMLIGKEIFDTETAIAAALLYAMSPIGLHFATSLWPRGHPCFVVWTILLSLLAVRRSNAKLLASGILVYAMGLYFFLEIAPLGVIFPIALSANREIRRPKPSYVLVFVAVVLVWFPWLAEEHKSGFRGALALATNSRLPLADSTHSCSVQPMYDCSSGKSVDIDDTPPPKKSSLREMVKNILFALTWNTNGRSNFSNGFLFEPIVGAVLLSWLTVGCLTIITDRRGGILLGTIIAAGSAIVAVIFDPWIFTRVVSRVGRIDPVSVPIFRTFESEFLCFSLLLLLFVRRQPTQRTAVGQSFVGWAFVAGQLFWTVLDGGTNRRFWWLWPLQCLLIAWGAQLVSGARLRKILLAGLVVIVALNPVLFGHLSSWRKSSWTGADDPMIEMLDVVAGQSTRSTSLSYEGPVQSWVFLINRIDSRYSSDMLFDAYLKLRYGLPNEISCAKGFDKRSVFFILDERRFPGCNCFRHSVPSPESYDQIAQREGVTLYKKRLSSAR